ncbi:FG-GAP-like repeat-containing protein [Marinilabilia salmonicolor]|uniref:FG-GAP-like repeat-containing protein n=1 Tax=Marinilabilia salmonicolor TaxID=989 RepID=UPI00029A7E92|nr:FG-GAP-like repeat-containing protein [Marinilabilia salmonicolor]
MKKKLLFIPRHKEWNRLVGKFHKLYRRVQLAFLDENSHSAEINNLLQKLQRVFARLEKLQHAVGIRLAGTAAALMFSGVLAFGQEFTARGELNVLEPAALQSWGRSMFFDVDGDGETELLQTMTYSGSNTGIAVFEEDESGAFINDGFLMADGVAINYYALGDFTFYDLSGDGIPELVVQVSSSIKVFSGNGGGSFSFNGDLMVDESTALYLDHLNAIEIADLDEDGNPELYAGITSSPPYRLPIRKFDIADGFAVNPTFLEAEEGVVLEDVRGFSFVDLDDDGTLEMVGSIYMDNHLKVFQNSGNDVFAGSEVLLDSKGDEILTNNGYFSFVHLNPSDDLLLSVSQSGELLRFLQSTPATTFVNDGTTSSLNHVDIDESWPFHFADIDKDGLDDLLLCMPDDSGGGGPLAPSAGQLKSGASSNPVRIFKNKGNEHFIFEEDLQVDGKDLETGVFAFTDLDDDGNVDLVYSGFVLYDPVGEEMFYEYLLVASYGDADGNFTGLQVLRTTGGDVLPSADLFNIAFEDLAGDGIPDLFGGTTNNSLKHFVNTGSGLENPVTEAVTYSITGNYPNGAALVDVDGDGDLDLSVSDTYYNKIAVFRNDGTGVLDFSNAVSFNTETLFADGAKIPVQTSGMATGPQITTSDFDNDCGRDLFVTMDNRIHRYAYVDITPLFIECVMNSSRDLDMGESAYLVSGTELDPVQVVDKCGVSLSNSFNEAASLSGAELPVGINTIIWTVTDQEGNAEECSFDIEITGDVTLIEEPSKISSLRIFPNPVGSVLNIVTATKGAYSISSLNGTRVANGELGASGGQIDVSGLSEGVYILQVIVDGETETTRFVKR